MKLFLLFYIYNQVEVLRVEIDMRKATSVAALWKPILGQRYNQVF